MKRIAILVPDLSLGGGQRSAVNTAEMLAEDNDVSIIVFSDENRVFETSCKVIDLCCLKKTNAVGKVSTIYKRYRSLKKHWRKEEYDIVISFLESANLCAFLTNRHKSILTLHLSPSMLSVFDQAILRHVFKHSNNLLAVSNGLKQHLLSTEHHFKNITVINNPVNPVRIKLLAQQNTFKHPKKFIVSAGRLTAQKRYDVMIDAFQQSQTSQTHDLIIIGAGEELEQLKQQSAAMDNVHLVGEMKNPFPVIEASEMFLMTSLYEAFPMVLLEALALEKPVVAYDCPTGLSDLIKHKHNGLLVENNHTKALVHSIDQVILNPTLLDDLSKHCLSSIEHYTFKSIKARWNDYLNIVHNKG